MRMMGVGFNMAMHHASNSSPSDISAFSPKPLKTEACMSACGRFIPRWYISIFAFFLDVIRSSLGSAAIMPCVWSCLSVHG